MCLQNVHHEVEQIKQKPFCKCNTPAGTDTSTSEVVIQEDALATFTRYTKSVLHSCADVYCNFEQSKLYRILTSTTQPAHLITVLVISVVGCLLYSNVHTKEENPSQILNLLYVCSVSVHFGTQVWMSFFSGLALYFSLPRHIFGKVQRVLFPKYFLLNSILSLISLSVFVKNNNSRINSPHVSLQIGILTSCCLIELIVRLYLTPPMLNLMVKTIAAEETNGVGQEIGKHDAGSLSQDETYLKLYKTFRKVHMVIAVCNIVTIACSVLHLHYLSSHLQFI